MFAALKSIIKSCLRRRDYFLFYVNPENLTGFDLEDDLERIITEAQPVIFDVGANEGQTILMLRRVFPSPRILSFEPSPRVFAALAKQSFCSTVRLFNAGLGSVPGSLAFHEFERSDLSSFHELSGSNANPFRDFPKIGTVEVVVDTVDQVVKREGIERLDLLKVDTQGHDLEVLRGARECLAAGKIRLVLVEMNYDSLYEGQASAAEVEAFLLSHGFRLVDLYEKHRKGHAIAWCTALYIRE